MTESVETSASLTPAPKTSGQTGTVVRSTVLKRLLKNPLGIIAIVILVAMAIMAIFADVLAPFDENYANIAKTLAAPDSVNVLGTDSSGRDVWSRLLFGAQLTLPSALLCAAVAIAIGLPAGLIAGYYAGKFEAVSNWIVSILMSLPGLIVLLTIRAAFGPSVWIAMIAFGILISPSYFRLTRSAVQSVRNELYVDAARVSGLSDLSIITRHIFSVVRAPIIIQTAAIAGVAIAIQSGLEFLGLGDPAKATWGVMLSEGFKNVYLTPTLLFWPAFAMALTIGALVLLGNAVRDALEDGEKIKHRRKPVTKDGTGTVRSGSQAPGTPKCCRRRRRNRTPPREGDQPGRRLPAGRRFGQEGGGRRLLPRGPRRNPGHRGRIRLGQVPDGILHPGPAAGQRPDCGRFHPVRRQLHRGPGRRTRQPGPALQTARQADLLHPAGTHVQPGSRLHHRLPAGHAHGARPRHLQGRSPSACTQTPGRRRDCQPGTDLHGLPPRGVRRHGPACADRRSHQLRT